MPEAHRPDDLPLHELRVLDLSDPVGQAATRLLADLGADVVTRTAAGEQSVHDLVNNANKRGARLDLSTPDGVAAAGALAARSDVVVLGLDESRALDPDKLLAERPDLVVVVSSRFGRTGPRRDWQATQRTLLALSGSLSRSGRPDDVPLLPPDGIADATAATSIAWSILVALTHVHRTGVGQVIDASHHEAVVTGLDPAFGAQGSAAAGRSGKFRRGRPPTDSYPIYPCADGFVRLCLLARRQWRGMFGWLGEPAEFADPKYDSIMERVLAKDALDALIIEHFSTRTGAELVAEAALRGVPLAQVLTLGEALQADHFVESGTVAPVELAPGLTVTTPVGCVDVDGVRLGIRAPAPTADAPGALAAWTDRPIPSQSQPGTPSLPFAGLRVLDLGVIVFGAEVGRAFADLGADVIKVESLAFPDGLRQTRGGEAMNASFAWGQRNKRSLGLDLRNPEGLALFLDLAAGADVVLSNFKPGTLEKLGIGPAVLAERNSGIVVLESAAFNSKGPWANRLGYGPLVRAACGISSLWRYDAADAECWDGVTVFPDHVAARVGAIAVAAALLRRERLGRGANLELGQSDVVLHQLAGWAATESLTPGSVAAVGNRGHELWGGLFACAGDDEWAVIDVRTPAELEALRDVVGDVDLEAAVPAWAATRTPAEVTETLQAVGIPASGMVRLNELLDDPQLQHRGTYTNLTHPELEGSLPTENATASLPALPQAPVEPAPLVGQHTRAIAAEHLGLDDVAVADLLERGVLHEGS